MISFDIEYNTTGATLAWKQHILTTYNDGSMNDEVSTVSRDLSFSVNENPYSVYHYEQINFEDKSELVEIIQGRMPIISRAYDADGNIIAENQGSVIPESWLENNEDVVTVDIGDGVTEIKDTAFYGCLNLINITIPNTVTELGNLIFQYCTSLTTVKLPEFITKIPNAIFNECVSFTGTIIPNNVSVIEGMAFKSCPSLSSITLPSGVTDIKNAAFLYCKNLNEITCLSENEPTIQDTLVFTGLPYVGTLYTPNSSSDWTTFLSYLPSGWKQVKKIVATSKAYDKNGNVLYEVEGDIPNRWLYSKTNVYRIEIADGVKSIGEEAFNNCSNITELIIPDSVTDIGNGYVANMCSNLTNLVIGNGVTSIGEAAFTNCQNLTSVTIGSNVTYIGSRAFNMCNKLDIVICLGKNEITNFGDVSPFKDIWRNGDVYTPNATDWWWTFLGKFEINWTQHFSLPN